MELSFDHLHYIAIEGVIGAGKTSLAIRLAETLGGDLVLEEFEENPFLEEFYQDPEHYAFQTQIFFLLSRFRQQEKLMQYDLFTQRVIADYMFYKDRIFATLNLNDKELALYNQVARVLEKRIAKPDLAIYLRASTERLMHNIRKRNRPYEKNIQPDYIEALNRLYDEFFWNYFETPLLIINTDNVDFVHNETHYQQILHEIARHRKGKKIVNFDFGQGLWK
ncbi:MAG: deoxynucleoside kinase [Calditrichaeota bacterium]|nr:MAG: deoxynucleoside kinase [Calditrichota bacterium]